MPTSKPSLKQRLQNGEMVLGAWNSIPSASLVNAMGLSGLDFVIIDAEHGPVSMETAEDLIRAAEVTPATPVVRVSSCQSHLILRALDIGAHGVEVPHISTQQEAQRVVKFAKYFPLGERGYSPLTRAGRYGLEADGYAQKANEGTMVVVHVEGKEGLRNLSEIVQVKGLDVIFIGPYDLSQSLGRPGKLDDPEIIENIRRSVGIIRNAGLACGSFAQEYRFLEILMDCGVQYLTFSVDAAFILKAYKDLCGIFEGKKRAVSHA